jgi:hypothetical protein
MRSLVHSLVAALAFITLADVDFSVRRMRQFAVDETRRQFPG